MSDLRELYQELIIDHGRRPRNFKKLPHADLTKEGFNPLCGDRLTLYCCMNQEYVTEVSFEGSGCAISMASASLMTEALKGKTREEIQELFDKFHALVTGQSQSNLGKLSVLAGVSAYPVRVKCATLAWRTALAMMEKQPGRISTE